MRGLFDMRAYKTALWMGYTYMWILVLCGFLLKDQKPSALVFWIVITFTLIIPFILAVVFAFKFGQKYRYAYFITGIPAVLVILLQYFLGSFIPNIVVPPGVMVHIVGPPHPFDILGQIFAALPIVGWAIIFPISGHLAVQLIGILHNTLQYKQK